MASSMGAAFSSTDPSKLAPGTSHDAAIRSMRNVFTLANDGGGTTNSLKAAALREGMCVRGARLASDVNCSGINFTIGTLADPVKYAAAFAGPAANAQVTVTIKVPMQAMDPLAAAEDVYLFPSGNTPGAGTLVSFIDVTKR